MRLPSRTTWTRGASYVLIVWIALHAAFIAIMVLSGVLGPDQRAIFLMGGALLVLWVGLCGALMIRYRDAFVKWVSRVPIGWRTRFVLLCTLFALIEEAITTTLTNLAPYLGAVSDAARITASKNYLEVVLMHSVIVFVPMFVGWAFLLSRYDFRPVEVFLLYGLTGVVAEASSFGLQNLAGAAFWVTVYGWMVYLPACTVPEDRHARPVKPRHAVIAVFLPFLAIVPFVPLILAVQWLYGRLT